MSFSLSTLSSTNAQTTQTSTQVSLVAFGSNYYHALGGTSPIQLTHESPHDVPAHCHNLSFVEKDDVIVKISCTCASTVFLTKNGKVYQSGTIHGTVFASPINVEIAIPLKCVQVAAGRHFCIGKMQGGLATVSWGAGHFGQLGQGPHVSALSRPRVMEHLLPQNVGAPVLQVAAGSWHALCITETGRSFGWGSNRRYQCGVKDENHETARQQDSLKPPTVVYPHPVDTSVVFSKIACGKSHSVGLEQETGKVYTWGASYTGQCGHASRRSSILPPRLVEALQKVVVVDVAAGDFHTLCLTGGGRVFSWGSGLEGQLGLGPAVPLARPKLVGDLDFVAICAGREWKHQQQQLKKQGFPMQLNPILQSSNSSRRHQLHTASSPVLVPTKEVNENASQIPVIPPNLHPEAVTRANCRVSAVPFSEGGEQKEQTQQDAQPHNLSSVPKIVAIDAAGSYSVAVSSSGHLYTWGYNDVGVLGLPKPPDSELRFAEPPIKGTQMSGRMLQVRTFDSRHNVLLPRRVDALGNQSIVSISAGRSYLWCLCRSRSPQAAQMEIVGETLYEIQEEQKQQSLVRLRQSYLPEKEKLLGAAMNTSSIFASNQKSAIHTEAVGQEQLIPQTAPIMHLPRLQKEGEVEEAQGNDNKGTAEERCSRPQLYERSSSQEQTNVRYNNSNGRLTKLIRKLKPKSGLKSSQHSNEVVDSQQLPAKMGRVRKVLASGFCKFDNDHDEDDNV